MPPLAVTKNRQDRGLCENRSESELLRTRPAALLVEQADPTVIPDPIIIAKAVGIDQGLYVVLRIGDERSAAIVVADIVAVLVAE